MIYKLIEDKGKYFYLIKYKSTFILYSIFNTLPDNLKIH